MRLHRSDEEEHRYQREEVLKFASIIASEPESPASVMVAASPLMWWLEEAKSEAERDARFQALSRHYDNRCVPSKQPRDDDGEGFVAAASAYATFLAAGDPE